MLKRSRGFSLIEFMIAMTIGLFLIAGLVYLIAETSRSRAEIERSSRQIENGRFALDRIAEDLRHAGYYGEYFSVPAAGAAGFPASLTAADPCATTIAALTTGVPLAIQAYDGGASLPSDLTGAGCTAANLVAANYQPGTDILVLRRASTTTIPSTTPALPFTSATPPRFLNQPYIQPNPVDYKLDVGSNTGTFNLTFPSANNTATYVAPLHRYMVRIYFVARCNVPASGVNCNGTTDDGGSSIPTLKVLELGVDPVAEAAGTASAAGPQFNLRAVAEGIEHLQYDFGVDDTGDGVADRIVMCDSTTPCSAVDFSNVVTVQVNIVARNTETSPAYADDKTYSLGLKGYTTVTNDKYRRHAYASQVRLNNIAMRRE
jgi:type IV pilus assembly protein PilW